MTGLVPTARPIPPHHGARHPRAQARTPRNWTPDGMVRPAVGLFCQSWSAFLFRGQGISAGFDDVKMVFARGANG
jgi:hypothetical protein